MGQPTLGGEHLFTPYAFVVDLEAEPQSRSIRTILASIRLSRVRDRTRKCGWGIEVWLLRLDVRSCLSTDNRWCSILVDPWHTKARARAGVGVPGKDRPAVGGESFEAWSKYRLQPKHTDSREAALQGMSFAQGQSRSLSRHLRADRLTPGTSRQAGLNGTCPSPIIPVQQSD